MIGDTYNNSQTRLQPGTTITRTCLTYLNDVEDTESTFAHFAAEAGTKHAAKADVSASLTDQLLSFFRNDITFRRQLRLYQPHSFTPSTLPRASKLYVACLLGLTAVAEGLLRDGISADAPVEAYFNGLPAASSNSHMGVVRLLLERDADINAHSHYHGNALQTASAQGHTDIVGLLLERDANVNAQGGYYGNALQAAVAEGHTDIV